MPLESQNRCEHEHYLGITQMYSGGNGYFAVPAYQANIGYNGH